MADHPHDILTLPLTGYLQPGEQLHRNILFEQLLTTLPKDGAVKVQIYNAEIAPGGHTSRHRHNGTTFFVALQGMFEARFEDGSVLRAKAGDVYSEPIGKVHRGHNAHAELPYLCIGIAMTPVDQDHVTEFPDDVLSGAPAARTPTTSRRDPPGS